MARVATQRAQAKELRSSLLDPATRYIDFALVFREVRRGKNGLEYTGRTSPRYGGVWDSLKPRPDGTMGGYCDREPTQIHVLDANPKQYEALCDDETFHLLYVGSRRSSKTELLSRWLVKQVVCWPCQLLSVVAQKRAKARKLVETKILRLLPTRWLLPGRSGVRRSQDELAICFRNRCSVAFLSGRVADDARGDGIPALGIDETQIVPAEMRDNAMLSMSEGGSKMQSLETATALAGEFEEYYEAALKDPRYKVELLSITDNIHLQTTMDPETGLQLPEFVISARSRMGKREFEQEIGRFDAASGRYIPQFVSDSGRVYWAFDRELHVAGFSGRRRGAEMAVRKLYDSAAPGVGSDITSELAARSFRKPVRYLAAIDVEKPPFAAVVCKVYAGPAGQPDVVWVVGEVTLPDEVDGTRLGLALQEAGFAGCGIIPDAAGRFSEGGRSTNAQLRALGFEVRGPKRNPADRDRLNAVLAKLRNAADQSSLLIDPSCKRLITAMRDHRFAPNGTESEMEHLEHHHARALGYLVHYFWPAHSRRDLKVA